ncbi:MAG: anaerobic ribonucleoside-triphosphate reductase [Candidatus Thorarchaeota archaeon]
MDADKNLNILEKQLKTLGQKVRIDILKRLKNTPTPLSFSKLQKDILGNDLSSVNLSFHLNILKKSELIFSSDEGYSITFLGEQIIDKILSIEKILNMQNKTRMIRTSKYSKELFDASKIEEYLVTEGELERYLARQIAREVEERLSKTNIEYMTAPLMREYINAVLLENGLEEVRHKLTRLGTPPFEVFKLFNSYNSQITPKIFIEKLGSDVSEQFLLLNLLPKNLADLYLSGEIALLHLNYWSLRPLSLYINTKALLDYLFNKYPDIKDEIEGKGKCTKLIIKFLDTLSILNQFYSEDLLLGNFNNQFLSYFPAQKAELFDFSFLTSQILRLNNLVNRVNPSLSLDFNYNKQLDEKSSIQPLIDERFLNSLNQISIKSLKPLLLIDFSTISPSISENDTLKNLIINDLKDNVIFYNKNCSNFCNSAVIRIPDLEENQVILDKILVNLHMISVEARQDDDKFLDLLHEKLISIFKLFDYKEKLVQKKLNPLKEWNSAVTNILNNNLEDIFKNALKSVSFFGFNEAILNHCGIELDRTEISESFSLKVLSFMKKIIEERNKENENCFILSQPHYDSYLQDSWHNGLTKHTNKINRYTSKLIRTESRLPLNKKIILFKKFQRVINGGTLFMEKIQLKETPIEKSLKIIFESEIGAISLKECLS